MTHLLDANLLVALLVEDHVHNDHARGWFGTGRTFATCPITQGSLLRFLVRTGAQAADARAALAALTAHPSHEFWADDLSYDAANLDHVIGHRQVTDAYLASLAASRSGRLATLDRGLAAARADVVDLIDTG